jgi:hypothetical protein
MKFNTSAFSVAVLLSHYSLCSAFTTPQVKPFKSLTGSSTQLHIIGPMIRKMREEKAKKNMPMASEDERQGEAPGLRVGTGAWKWPPVWPYGDSDFIPKEDIVEPKESSPVTGLLAGNIPNPDDVVEEEEEKIATLDILKYWGEEKNSVKTEIDAEAAQKLKE